MGEKIFFVTADIGSDSFKAQAGIDDYFMFTDILPGSDTTPFMFMGRLAPYSGSTTSEQIVFRLRNLDFGPPSDTQFVSLASQTDLEYHRVDSKPFYAVKFRSSLSSPHDALKWNFGDGSTSTEISPSHLYAADGPGIYNVCLNVDYSQGCSDVICCDIFLPSSTCSYSIAVDSIGSNEYVYRAVVNGSGPYSYLWQLNNNVSPTSAEIKYAYGPSASFIEDVRLQVFDANACSGAVALKLNVGNSTDCYSNFSHDAIQLMDSLDPGFGKVMIDYISPDGQKWSSHLGGQDANSSFSILSLSDYKVNEKGQLTSKLEIAFDCILYNEVGEEVLLRNGKAVIALAHP